jgi:hypothetical protein
MQSIADLRKYVAKEQAENGTKPFSTFFSNSGAVGLSQPNIPLPMSQQETKRRRRINIEAA